MTDSTAASNEEEMAALRAGLDQFGAMGRELADHFGQFSEVLQRHQVPEKTAHSIILRLLDQALPPPKSSLAGLFPQLGDE